MELKEITYDQEYMISYLLGTEFEKRMFDVYIGVSNHSRPPYLEEMFFAATQMQALLQLEKTRRQPGTMNLTEHQWGQMYRDVWNDCENAKMQVLSYSNVHDYEAVLNDIGAFLYRNRLSFLTRNSHYPDKQMAKIVFPPIVSVW